jgi:hypothetical protein
MAVRPLQFQASHQNSGGTVMEESRRARLRKQRWNKFCEAEQANWTSVLNERGRIKMLFDPVSGDRFRRFLKFCDNLNDTGDYLLILGFDGAGDIMEIRIIRRKPD